MAHGATSTWTSENPPSPAFPPPPSCEEEDLEGLHMNMNQGPLSPDRQVHSVPHNYEKEETPQDNNYQPQGQLQYGDVSMDEDENDPPEDQKKAEALLKEAMGLKESPATYVPKSPKYVRDSEDEGVQDLSDDDIEAPYLAPHRNLEQGHATQDIQATTSNQKCLQASTSDQECLQATRSVHKQPGVSASDQKCLQASTSNQECLQVTRSVHKQPGVSASDQKCLQAFTSDQECLQATRSVHKQPGVSASNQKCLQAPTSNQECLQATRSVYK